MITEKVLSNFDDMKESKTTVIYQNIDLSASVAPSIMIKDSRLTVQDFGDRNFMGTENSGTNLIGRRYKTMQNIFAGED